MCLSRTRADMHHKFNAPPGSRRFEQCNSVAQVGTALRSATARAARGPWSGTSASRVTPTASEVSVAVAHAVRSGRTPERVRFRIVWQDGWPESVHEVLLFPYAHRLIQEMSAEGAKPDTIAARLNREGVLTKYQTMWSATTVARQLARDRARSRGARRHSTANPAPASRRALTTVIAGAS